MINVGEYIGTKIRYYRTKRNMTQDELGKKLGTKKATISNYETGYRTPNQDVLFELAEIFEISINNLFPPTEKSTISTVYNKLEPMRQNKVYNYAKDQLDEQIIQSVNVYGQTAAGSALEYDQSTIEEEKVSYVPKGTDGALIVRGDSMEPLLKNNELLFFKKTPQIENGDIAVVEIEGNAVTTKKVKYDFGNEKIILQSLNEKYDDMVFDNEDIRIIGKVLL